MIGNGNHLELGRIEGLCCFHMQNALKQCGKRSKNVVPYILHVNKICAVFSRYISCTSLAYNTRGSCIISMHF
jgi:hypothetical protein